MRLSLSLVVAALSACVAARPQSQSLGGKRRYSVVPLEPEDDDVTIVQTIVRTEPPITHVITTTAQPATVTVTSGTTHTLSLPNSSSVSSWTVRSPTATLAPAYSSGTASSPCCSDAAVQTVTLVASIYGTSVDVRPSVAVLTLRRPTPSTTLETSRVSSVLTAPSSSQAWSSLSSSPSLSGSLPSLAPSSMASSLPGEVLPQTKLSPWNVTLSSRSP